MLERLRLAVPADVLVSMLGYIGRAEAVPLLAKMLNDKDPAVADRAGDVGWADEDLPAAAAIRCSPSSDFSDGLRPS